MGGLNSFLVTIFNGCFDFFIISIKPSFYTFASNYNTYLNLPLTFNLTTFFSILLSPKNFYDTSFNLTVISQLIPYKFLTSNFEKVESYGTIPFESQSIFDKNTFSFQEQRSYYR